MKEFKKWLSENGFRNPRQDRHSPYGTLVNFWSPEEIKCAQKGWRAVLKRIKFIYEELEEKDGDYIARAVKKFIEQELEGK